jgi:SAM-dependent methyltransferase
MRRNERRIHDDALRRARVAAYAPGQFVGQESFMQAREILALARRAGIGPGVSVVDLCCGVAGPGSLIAAELGCSYLGVDADADAVALARRRCARLPCRFEVARVPPVPGGPYDVVLLLETFLAFPDKAALLAGIADSLVTGGRLAVTVEEGAPLTPAERAGMPEADTVWLLRLADLLDELDRIGLRVEWLQECSASHRRTVDALIHAFVADEPAITRRLGRSRLDDLLTGHRLWSTWLADGRVRKFEVVAQKAATSGDEPQALPRRTH